MLGTDETNLITNSRCGGSRNHELKMHRARSLAVEVFFSLNAFDFAEVPAAMKAKTRGEIISISGLWKISKTSPAPKVPQPVYVVNWLTILRKPIYQGYSVSFPPRHWVAIGLSPMSWNRRSLRLWVMYTSSGQLSLYSRFYRAPSYNFIIYLFIMQFGPPAREWLRFIF